MQEEEKNKLSQQAKKTMAYTDAVSRVSIEFLTKRLDRIEEFMDRLTTIQEDMSKLLTANIERISDCKSQTDNLNHIIRQLQIKIDAIEKILWQYVGIVSFITMLITAGPILYRTIFPAH
jgi:hypothetical protein